VRCHVPRVIGATLKKAKALIRNTDCTLGRVRSARSRRSLRGRVVAQNPSAGRIRREGFPIKLVLGRR
jgi:beta-lactam-binding protein with PASTA domain